ncbi:IgGFc-binding protein-like [Acanthaster planci]|uniref:IgGFc-binding protein-like n=1 Tax=Acanthaster planci TaxID=133434 RepID=A0A8B7YST4_ACAPL|nr:IgGFc-binding protein-like [Acanthaster planci]
MVLLILTLLFLVRGNSIGDCMAEVQNNVGQKFIFAYAENYRPNADPSVIVTNMSPLDHAVVAITITTPVHGLIKTVTLQGWGNSEQVTLPRELVPVSPDFDMVAIIVQANDSVTVYAINDAHEYSMDGFTVLPVSSLGTEYFVASYTPLFQSQIVIVATKDNTEVEVELSNTVTYKNREVEGGNIILIDAKGYDATLLRGGTDLTGTRVRSNHPIAVLSGNRCTRVPVDVDSFDHLMEMLPPFSQWGRQFVVMPFLGRSTGVIYRVISGRDNTEITVNSKMMRLQKEQYLEFEVGVGQSDFVESNNPVQVVQYAKGLHADNVIGDPAMTIVPPMEQSIQTAWLPTYNTTKVLQTVQNYVNIYAPCTEMYYGNLTMDGMVLRDIVPADRIVRIDSSAYCGVGLYLTHGVHDIGPAAQGRESFVAIAYGFAERNAFAWPVGLGTRAITCLYRGQDGVQLEHDCSKALVIQHIPCNASETVDVDECVNVDCVPNEYVIYISAGVAVGAIILSKLFSVCVIQRTKTPKQLAFGQAGVVSPPPDIAVHHGSDEDLVIEKAATATSLRPPSPHAPRRSFRSERADRMRRSSRSPSPAPSSFA